MLLAIDVGNTNTVLGVYQGTVLRDHWRIETSHARTADEYGVLIRQLFAGQGIEPTQIDALVISSVVPPLGHTLEEMSRRYFSRPPLFVEPGVKTGIPILYENPREVGADRVVNAVAAYERWRCPLVVVDFGTATTFDAISAKGEYLGGAIAPGIGISAEALFMRTARLPRVDIRKTPKVICTNTVASLQSGLYHGYVGLVDGVLERMVAELGKAEVVATGGLARLIGTGSKYISTVDDLLTLEGMRIIWERHNAYQRRKQEGHKVAEGEHQEK